MDDYIAFIFSGANDLHFSNVIASIAATGGKDGLFGGEAFRHTFNSFVWKGTRDRQTLRNERRGSAALVESKVFE